MWAAFSGSPNISSHPGSGPRIIFRAGGLPALFKKKKKQKQTLPPLDEEVTGTCPGILRAGVETGILRAGVPEGEMSLRYKAQLLPAFAATGGSRACVLDDRALCQPDTVIYSMSCTHRTAANRKGARALLISLLSSAPRDPPSHGEVFRVSGLKKTENIT